ncbi:MAG: site-specific DNA-methyltransferase [Anaerolineae bacterium]
MPRKPKPAPASRARKRPAYRVRKQAAPPPDEAHGREREIESYQHTQAERVNNPPVGILHADNDPDLAAGQKTYAYDPHLDPSLQWAGKAEHTSFAVPTVSLHVHERIDPRTIVEAVRKREEQEEPPLYQQLSMFSTARENPPYREAIEFYKHRHNWSNRLIAGDSLIVMNSLLEKEGMAGQVQMIYLDPPYGIKYGSNFQPFVNKRDVKDGKDEDLTQEPEMVKAFRDTWELGIHSYLTYLRDRLLLAKELLHESGSVFVQISDENVHRVRMLMDEVFGADNFTSLISYQTSVSAGARTLDKVSDYVIWYAKNKDAIKFRNLFRALTPGEEGATRFNKIESPDHKEWRHLSDEERRDRDKIPDGWRLFTDQGLTSRGSGSEKTMAAFNFGGQEFFPPAGHWRTGIDGLTILAKKGRIIQAGSTIRYKKYFDDFPFLSLTNIWSDTGGGIQSRSDPKIYVVQTTNKIIERCMLMTTDPGDLVFDPTCGSGTTAYVAEQWGRRWITCDTSRVAIGLAKQRVMTALFDYYELARSDEGVDSGFRYKTVPHVYLESLAKNEEPPIETLFDCPFTDNSKARVTGPFTVEAVPAPTVKPLADLETEPVADESIARGGETLRQSQWRDELLRTGLRGKGGNKIEFTRVEPLTGTRWLHAEAETRPSPVDGVSPRREEGGVGGGGKPQKVVVSFGSAFAPLEQRQVELAMEEAESLVPKPKLVVFAAFQFDPEAAKDIEETKWPGGTILKAQMNTDLLTDDLKKKRASNESFWLIGQPDVTLDRIKTGEHKGKYRVAVHGFDYYNPRTGNIESGGTAQIAMWLLDPDYDGRSLFPRQVFFPMANEKEGWARLARNLKAEIDEELIEAYRGTESLPFEAGKHRRVAVKIVDDRGIESLKVVEVE